MTDHYADWKALRVLGAALFGRNNLIPSDFKDMAAERVESEFKQDSQGLRVTFTVSNNALGKIMSSQEIADALKRLRRAR